MQGEAEDSVVSPQPSQPVVLTLWGQLFIHSLISQTKGP